MLCWKTCKINYYLMIQNLALVTGGAGLTERGGGETCKRHV